MCLSGLACVACLGWSGSTLYAESIMLVFLARRLIYRKIHQSFPHCRRIDASATNDVWRHCDDGRNCLYWTIYRIFSAFYNQFIYDYYANSAFQFLSAQTCWIRMLQTFCMLESVKKPSCDMLTCWISNHWRPGEYWHTYHLTETFSVNLYLLGPFIWIM